MAKDAVEIDSEKEMVKLSSLQSMQSNKFGTLEKEKLEKFLNQNAGEGTTEVRPGYNSYLVEFKDTERIYRVENDGTVKGPIFNEKRLTLGQEGPRNTEKYGWRVKNYNVEYSCVNSSSKVSNVWRLFYQDEKFTYLITDEFTEYRSIQGQYKGKYIDGTQMSIVGQKLNEKVNSVFTNENTKANDNVLATIWLTDTENEKWAQYKNEDAIFCIGSPTIELFAASYNNNTNDTHKNFEKYKITTSLNKSNLIGYDVSVNAKELGYLLQEDSYGIYAKEGNSLYLASPSNLARMLRSK